MELQTMPLRFRVWNKNTDSFYTVRDAYPLIQLSKEEASSIEFSLQDLVVLLDGILYYDDSSEYIISQDTGFKDKNGKRIFFGDIVKWGYLQGIVSYKEGCVCLAAQPNDFYPDWEEDKPYLELCGNIWQNFDFLKEG